MREDFIPETNINPFMLPVCSLYMLLRCYVSHIVLRPIHIDLHMRGYVSSLRGHVTRHDTHTQAYTCVYIYTQELGRVDDGGN